MATDSSQQSAGRAPAGTGTALGYARRREITGVDRPAAERAVAARLLSVMAVFVLAAATASCTATDATRQHFSQVWIPEARDNVFCGAMGLSDAVEYERTERGAALHFLTDEARVETLREELLELTTNPRLRSALGSSCSGGVKTRPPAPKVPVDEMKAHGGGGSTSTSRRSTGRARTRREASSARVGKVTLHYERTARGGRLVVRAVEARDEDSLRAHLRRHVLHLSNGTCDWKRAS